MDITLVAPQTWSDWVEALTAMFAPPDLLTNLCLEIATLRQSDEKHPGENVGQYALRISNLFTRLLTEAARTTSPTKSAQSFAWERLKIVVFENGSIPPIRIEQIREDPANSFASARDRARKYASNNLHGVNATSLSSVRSTAPLENQLETRLDDVQATIVSLEEAPASPRHRGRSKTERQATRGRQDNSASKRDRSSGKAKATRSTRPNTCHYEHCMRPSTHKTDDCLFAKLAAKIGTDSGRSPERYVSDRFGSIATASTTAVVTTRHPQYLVVTTVGTEGTNTVAVAAKADGRSTPSAVLTLQRSFATGARSNKHPS